MTETSLPAPDTSATRQIPADICIVTHALPEQVEAQLAQGRAVHHHVPDALRSGAAQSHATVLVTDPGVGADAALIASMPQLRMIACYGVGTDAIDLDAAARRGITVANTPGLLADAVADMAMALLLASARNIVQADSYVRQGGWKSLVAALPLGRSLNGQALGIVGLGSIGQAVARRAQGFGLEVAYHGPRRKPDQPYEHVADLVELARASDFLVLSCSGGEATRHLVNREVLDALGPQGTLVNVARGSVVDEEALVAALETGTLGFAGLDVFAQEPAVPAALKAMPNVVLTPHHANATLGTRLAMGELLVDNVAAFLSGRMPATAFPLRATRDR